MDIFNSDGIIKSLPFPFEPYVITEQDFIELAKSIKSGKLLPCLDDDISNNVKTGELKLKTNKFGNPTLGPINCSSSCESDGSLETDFLLQKMVSDGYLSLDDYRKLCFDFSEVEK